MIITELLQYVDSQMQKTPLEAPKTPLKARFVAFWCMILMLSACAPAEEETANWGNMDYARVACENGHCPDPKKMEEGEKDHHRNRGKR